MIRSGLRDSSPFPLAALMIISRACWRDATLSSVAGSSWTCANVNLLKNVAGAWMTVMAECTNAE